VSGHSKWSTIKHKKGIADKRRGQEFSKLSKAIIIAAREGADPESNFKLRLAVEKAKQANVPNENIKRAIEKGSGTGGEQNLETVVYEGFGPEQAAVMIEVITDNKNRTIAEVKNFFEKRGGRLAGPGGVSYLFEQVGLIFLKNPADEAEAILKIMDFGVENVEKTEAGIEVYCRPEALESVAAKIQESGFKIREKDLVMNPKTPLKIDDPVKRKKITQFLADLEDQDDVQRVFANVDLAD
jgi:YebC/PmpR family DNA-binding regulatory protein